MHRRRCKAKRLRKLFKAVNIRFCASRNLLRSFFAAASDAWCFTVGLVLSLAS